jgi:predicted MFS family arabinose efflux permease
MQFNWHESQVSTLFAFAGVQITLVYIALHYITKKFSDQSILLAGYIILSIACLVAVLFLPFSTVGSTKLLPLFLLFVALDILSLPLIVVPTASLFLQHTSHDHQGIGQGVQRSIINVATIVGPLFAGTLLKSTWIMLCCMLIIVVFATLLVIYMYRKFRLKPNDEQTALLSSTHNHD